MVNKVENRNVDSVVIYHSKNVCAAVTHGFWYDTNVRLTFVSAQQRGFVAICGDGELFGTDYVLYAKSIDAGWGWEIGIDPGVRYRFVAIPTAKMETWCDASKVFGVVGGRKRGNTR